MMLGHAALAFALAASVAHVLGWSRERVLAFGLVAAGFAIVPDADMVYALTGPIGGVNGAMDAANEFWGASTLVHRSITHSLLLALPAGIAFAAWTVRQEHRRLARAGAAAIAVGVILVATIHNGVLGAIVGTAFVAAGLAVATVARRRTALAPAQVLAAAWLGLLTHPWGDLFTGEPPAFLYPLDATLFASRVTLSADPTVHLLAVFGLELATAWAVVAVLRAVADEPSIGAIERKAVLGVGFAAATTVLPPPTLDFSYHFVFSILGIGTLLGAPRLGGGAVQFVRRQHLDVDRLRRATMTGLTAVTLAWSGYVAVYLLL